MDRLAILILGNVKNTNKHYTKMLCFFCFFCICNNKRFAGCKFFFNWYCFLLDLYLKIIRNKGMNLWNMVSLQDIIYVYHIAVQYIIVFIILLSLHFFFQCVCTADEPFSNASFINTHSHGMFYTCCHGYRCWNARIWLSSNSSYIWGFFRYLGECKLPKIVVLVYYNFNKLPKQKGNCNRS